MSTCSIPSNQPIYQALLDKAASYPADKVYQAKAYKKAALKIDEDGVDLYEIVDFLEPGIMRGIGSSISDFIINFIKQNPKTVTATPTAFPPIPFIVAENDEEEIDNYDDDDYDSDDDDSNYSCYCTNCVNRRLPPLSRQNAVTSTSATIPEAIAPTPIVTPTTLRRSERIAKLPSPDYCS